MGAVDSVAFVSVVSFVVATASLSLVVVAVAFSCVVMLLSETVDDGCNVVIGVVCSPAVGCGEAWVEVSVVEMGWSIGVDNKTGMT